MDMLNAIMTMQNDLQDRLGIYFGSMQDEERAEFMRNHRGYLEDELAEALYEMPYYKTWKNYRDMSEEDREAAWQKVRMELVDSLHFFMNLLLCAGFTAEDLYSMYCAKNAENHRRQDAGYDAGMSYRDQPVEDVMKDTPTCMIQMGEERVGSSDFIALLNHPDGSSNILYNTTLPNLAVAYYKMKALFEAELENVSDEERTLYINFGKDLGGAFEPRKAGVADE